LSIYLAIFGKPRYLGLLNLEEPVPPKGSWIVAETMRGLELGLLGGILSEEQEERYRKSCNDDNSDGQVKGGEPALQEITFLRQASPEDLAEGELEREEENAVLLKARELLRTHGLPMKLVDVEYLLDRKKLFFYFTSEQRVDFRSFVRDLAKEFKTRIELRQIGVRDEAKAVKGIAPCGQRCCCSYWLHRFTPICIKMVKEQNLALNPTKISGICGRLMCCMSYEHHMYGNLWKGLPNPGSKIRTENGTFLLEGVELSSESVRIRTPEGKEILVRTSDFPRFKETVTEGRAWDEDTRKDALPVNEEPFRPARRRSPAKKEEDLQEKKPQVQEKKKPAEHQDAKESQGEGKAAEGQPAGNLPAKKKKRRKRKHPQGEKNQVRQPDTGVKEKEETGTEGKQEEPKKPQEGGAKKRSRPRRRRPQKKNDGGAQSSQQSGQNKNASSEV